MSKPKEMGPLSGFRDLLAEQMIPRGRMVETIKEVYESYGFTPLDTPALERYETLQGKYGSEGEKLMYKFTDHGGRLLALRYDLTVPLARVVSQHQNELPMPYKRYQVGNVWRGESPQAGRYREFMQFDADTVGTTSVIADAEIVAMMSDAMRALGADAIVRVNNRKILDALAEKAQTQDELTKRQLISTVDKVEKIGIGAALEQITENFGSQTADVVRTYLNVSGSSMDKLKALETLLGHSEAIQEGVSNLTQIFSILEASGYSTDQIVFDQTIARGLDYYTGTIYETTLKDLPQIGSVCSGGRFDNLVALLGGPDLPAVGTSIGVDRLFAALQKLGKLEGVRTKSQVLVANFDSQYAPEYMKIASQLRQEGISTEIYYEPGKIRKQLGFANQMGIRFVVLIGSDEISQGYATIRDLDRQEQQQIPLEQLSSVIQTISTQA